VSVFHRRVRSLLGRWRLGLAVGAAVLVAGCGPLIDVDQARLCRMALPAIVDDGVAIHIARQAADEDGRGLRVDYAGAEQAPHFVHCRFIAPGRPRRSQDLVALDTDRGPLSDYQLSILIRFWLATPEARAADPLPIAGAADAPHVSFALAYGVQQAINGLPLAAIYGLLAAAYSLVYGLVGRINLAFGELAAAGGYAAAFGMILMPSTGPWGPVLLALALAVTTAVSYGVASGRLAFAPLRNASGQQALVATVGLALFLQEFLRLTQGSSLHWVNPILNEPFAVLRSDTFVAAATPIALLSGVVALAAAGGLLLTMRFTEFGRQWRAYADDPFAAALFGVDPRAIFARTFALASMMAGLAGYVMTIFYGGLGYGGSTALGLKALIAAIMGGIGSVPGAFLGGLLIGAFEAAWSALYPIDYRDVAVYSLLAIVLILRPGGLLRREAIPQRRG
jgi:branched-chain amino acid transport system permease protein